jgi:hypothetical protein
MSLKECKSTEPPGLRIRRDPSLDVVAGEPLIPSPPIRLRQNRAWMEPNNIWRTNKKVEGFITYKVKGGYSVAVVGLTTPPPGSILITKKKSK